MSLCCGMSVRRPVVKFDTILPDSVGDNLYAKVGEVKTVVENDEKPDGTKLTIAEALVGDDTACILLTLRNGREWLRGRFSLKLLTIRDGYE